MQNLYFGTWLLCEIYSPTQMMHVRASGKPVEVWLDAKPSTKVTCDWTQPRIAGMRVVILVTVKNQLDQFLTGNHVNQSYLGIGHLSGQE